jgi:serine-type D-Ala-D-Ala carboxypeptidase (penicillin-binding protein 5/6)
MSRKIIIQFLLLLLVSSTFAAPNGNFKATVLIDAESGEILDSYNEHKVLPPASMVKMMTELIVLELIKSGELSNDDIVKVSAKASKMGGSQVYLAHNEEFPVVELLKALSIQSANDAAVALAEYTSGSTIAFVELMNQRARELGMNDTEFHSVHGLPPGYGQKSDLSSPYDMALIGRELSKYPEALEWAVSDQVPFRDGKFLLTNPNPLVGKFRGLEGIKTGYTSSAGFCLTAAATQKGLRLISCVMGASTNRARGEETTRLLARGFAMYTRVTLIALAGELMDIETRVSAGRLKNTTLAYAEPLIAGMRKDAVGQVELVHILPEKIKAPLEKGEIVGSARAILNGKILGEVDLITAETIEEGNWWEKLIHK